MKDEVFRTFWSGIKFDDISSVDESELGGAGSMMKESIRAKEQLSLLLEFTER